MAEKALCGGHPEPGDLVIQKLARGLCPLPPGRPSSRCIAQGPRVGPARGDVGARLAGEPWSPRRLHSHRISGASASPRSRTCPSPVGTGCPIVPWLCPWKRPSRAAEPQQAGPWPPSVLPPPHREPPRRPETPGGGFREGPPPPPGRGPSPQLVLAEVVDIERLASLGQHLLLHLPGGLLLASLLVSLGGHARGRTQEGGTLRGSAPGPEAGGPEAGGRPAPCAHLGQVAAVVGAHGGQGLLLLQVVLGSPLGVLLLPAGLLLLQRPRPTTQGRARCPSPQAPGSPRPPRPALSRSSRSWAGPARSQGCCRGLVTG